ncbi:unknown [Clostridium sp. CAG:343]|jgi:hypothetical protein|nr:unknown [Clostridium sp. CAG:343]
MEISFEKRYILLYTLIIAISHHIILNLNVIYPNLISEIWPIDAILLVFTLLFLSMFDRNKKQRIALGIFYKKTPFEKAKEYIKNDKRIDKNNYKIKELNNIPNFIFYRDYYKPVEKNNIVESKNAEYCIIRDIVFLIFIFVIVFIVLTIIWTSYFWKELIAITIAYIIGVISCRLKSKDFVSQIVVEKINKKEEKK